MATLKPSQEILTQGVDQARLEKGAWYSNVLTKQKAWEVRQGFGTLAQLDSTLATPQTGTDPRGFRRVLGSHLLRTDWGLQVVSIVEHENTETSEMVGTGQTLSLVSVLVYDIETDRHVEEPLYRHTRNMSTLETALPRGATGGVYAVGDDPVFFCEYMGNLLMGSASLGLWIYRPIDPDMALSCQEDATHPQMTRPAYGEAAWLVPVVATEGQFADNYGYLDTIPNPVAAANLAGRLVTANQRELYFHDPGRPGCVSGLNVLTIPDQRELTAVAEISGNLLIFTASSTWLYRPPVSYNLAQGELTLISDDIGCVSALSHTKASGGLIWAAHNGMYASGGLAEISPLSNALEPLFTSEVSNPVTQFLVANGATTLLSPQPRTFYSWRDLWRLSLSYDSLTRCLFVSVPEQACCWVFQDGSWMHWNLETVANMLTPATVQARQKLPLPQVLGRDGRIFLVAGVESYAVGDSTRTAGDPMRPENLNTQPGSVIITEYGRGGSSDRTSRLSEDRRVTASGYTTLKSGSIGFRVGKPVRVPADWQYPAGTQINTETVLFPLELDVTGIVAPDHLDLYLEFDNTRWKPVCRAGSPELDAVYPPERLTSATGYSPGAPVGGTAEHQVYFAGAPSSVGNQLRIRWDGATGMAVAPWSTSPRLNALPGNTTPLLWFGLEPLPVLTGDSIGCGFESSLAQHKDGANTHPVGVVGYVEAQPIGLVTDDEAMQAIDWSIKSDPITAPKAQVRTRGILGRILTHGRSVVNAWGQLNFLVGSDRKDWSSQILDWVDTQDADLSQQTKTYDDLNTTPNVNTVRTRHRPTGGADTFKTLNRALTWGDTLTPSAGNYLVDDEAVDRLSLSDSVKGDSVTWMVFGHQQGYAERTVLLTLEAQIEQAGLQRR